MSQNVPKNGKGRRTQKTGMPEPARLTEKQELAANLVSEDRLTDEQIAEELGIDRRTLTRWKDIPEFSARVQAISEAFAQRVMSRGIARRVHRVAVMDDIHRKLLTVIEKRATNPEISKAPGGETGLVTRTVRGIGRGDDYQVVEVFEVDTPLCREIREVHAQVAEELGQRVQKHEFTMLNKMFEQMKPDELLDTRSAASCRRGSPRSSNRFVRSSYAVASGSTITS
jgi:hypothetical protein